jgi:hypothetical protein
MTACLICGCSPCVNPDFCRACRAADRRKVRLPPAPPPIDTEAPYATYNAVVYELRTYGLAQLSKLNCQRRLSDLSAAQIKNVIASLQQRRGQYPNVCDELLITLATIYDARVMADA